MFKRVTLLGLAQNLGHDTLTKTPKSLALRASKSEPASKMYERQSHDLSLGTRKTYRAIFSAPKLVIPPPDSDSSDDEGQDKTDGQITGTADAKDPLTNTMPQGMSAPPPVTMLEPPLVSASYDHPTSPRSSAQKRVREEAVADESGAHGPANVEDPGPTDKTSSKVHGATTAPIIEPKQKKQKKNKK
jgi:hypothetical protein